jgi:hypothetical protein
MTLSEFNQESEPSDVENLTTPSNQTWVGHRGLPAAVSDDDEEDEVSEEKNESEEESSDAELGKPNQSKK